MTGSHKPRKKPVARMITTGAVTLVLYAILFLREDTITRCFTRGGFYALFPIGTALLFSLVHGLFSGSFWSVIGVEAATERERQAGDE